MKKIVLLLILFLLSCAQLMAQGNASRTGDNLFSGTQTFSGPVNAKNINSIRYADQFVGADCGAKINAADADLGATPGEILVNQACGMTWTTAVVLSTSHALRFIQYGTYSTNAGITLNAQAGILCDGPQIQNTPPCQVYETNGANLPALITVNGQGAFLRDVFINGNKGPANQTAGVCVKINLAQRFTIENSTIGACQTHAVWAHSTGTNKESAALKIVHSMLQSSFGDGVFMENTSDSFIGGQSEAGNNGLITSAPARPLVSTTSTTITYASGGPLTGWSTDSSLVGTMLRVNDAIRCQVLAVPSTTTITVSATQCWNNSGVAAALGVLTNVPLNWGNGIELFNSPTTRISYQDIGANAMDGILVWGTTAGLGSNQESLGSNVVFGGNLENGIEIIGYDTVGGGFVSGNNNIVGDVLDGGTNQPATATWSNILLVDSPNNVISGNSLDGGGGSTHQKYGISVVESAAGRAGSNSVGGISVFNTANYATSVYNDPTNSGSIGTQIPCRAGTTASLDLFDTTTAAATPHTYLCTSGGNFYVRNNSAVPIFQLDQAGDAFIYATLVPNANGLNIGQGTQPWGNLFLGTAATNNFKFQPAATSAARVISILDPGGATTLDLTSNTSTTTTQVLHASATAGMGTWSAIATGDLPTAIPIGNVGSAGLSGTAPVAIAATGAISCTTCTNKNSAIVNFNQAAQTQVVVSGTEYYVTRSDLDMPAAYTTAIAAGTTMFWRVSLTKTAAGTGTFQVLLKKGTNGSTADTSIVTQTIGTQTAVADNMEMDVELTWTSTTAAYWTIIPHQSAATGTGFGLVYPATAAQFSGTIAGQTTTTASDKYGLSLIFTTGTPTFVVNQVKAEAFGVN